MRLAEGPRRLRQNPFRPQVRKSRSRPHSESEIPRQFVAYGVVGVAGTLLDVGLFWILVRAGLWTPAAVTLAFFTATAVQFFFNRHWSFRAFHRPASVQASEYAIITLVNWLLALAIVEMGVAWLHLSPLLAKALSIPPTAIAGFVGNRYLTFGAGISETFRRRAERTRGKRKGGVR
jgi:putative flippase GtrA